VLEDAGIKLTCVATAVLGKSGRAILAALLAGTSDANVLAELARGRMRAKLPALRQALVGQFRAHHAFLLTHRLAHIDYLDERIDAISEQIAAAIQPFREQVDRLEAMPGVNRRTAEVLIAEVGVDMTVFPSPRQLASWAGVCPGNHESAGKRRSGRTRKGNRWLRMALTEAASSVSRTTNTAFGARYRRIMRHAGHKKAVIAVAHAILVTA
jgi:transposase